MAEHEPSIGATSDWYTPPIYFEKLGLTFDLDPCSPGSGHWVPARKIYTKEDDGLSQPWHGLVFMNPPHGKGRRLAVPWLRKFFDHGNGVAICRAYTSCDYWHALVWPRAELLCFPRGKIKFIRPDGSIGEAPGHGSVFIAAGDVARAALRQSGIGVCVIVERNHKEAAGELARMEVAA
jgi:DNA N-6-adenine-methyltransferase (Dam)